MEITQRTVLLHYHLFKNAGTSLDQILKKNFGDAWVTVEFTQAGGNNTAQVEEWIANTPDAVAFSSHTMRGPLPQVENVHIIPIMLLRDPIARIRSAYRFERNQQADTWGAKLAKQEDFEGYVKARLARDKDRQCRNFQSSRLAGLMPGPGSEFRRALQAAEMLNEVGVLGTVERFDAALKKLDDKISPTYPHVKIETVRANTSKGKTQSHDLPELDLLLERSNQIDSVIFNEVLSWT